MKARKIERLAIANRGEVAVRIIRACQELGIETILLHSEPDVETLAYRLADRCVLIGPAEARKSYLDIPKNITAALSAEADAIHPGFGFLSENADFAEACEKARIIFVGPSAESIRLFGNKISAKNLVKRVGAPIIPGYDGADQSDRKLISEIEAIGLPVMVKAAGGGGGRGLRVIRSLDSASETIASARREALSAFGNDKVFLEKYLENAKHIEFQIFGDASGRIFNLSERECSVQRRHQKIVEEAPAAKLDPNLRRRMAVVAKEIAETAKYSGAGTIEFLVQDGDFYFMEMNTRLQVEHPVTEMVLGVDLVKAQLLSAQGQGLLWSQDELVPRGHSIECRLYAEDSYNGGIPSTGRVHFMDFPQGAGRRFEFGIESGDEVTSYYDPMIAKIIVWDESRPRAIRKMIETLKETVIFGVRTNIPYLIKILQHGDFVDGKMTTQFIEKYLKNGVGAQEISSDVEELAKSLAAVSVSENKPETKTNDSPWLIRRS